jgi:glycerophosphoryl diester phosphodiesterase
VRQWDCGAIRNPAFPRQQTVPGARIPTLDEVFALAPKGSFEFNIEIKSFPNRPELTPPPAEFARLVLEAIRRYHLEDRVIVQSFDFRTLHAMKKLAPEIRMSALYLGMQRDLVALARRGGTRIVSPNFRLVSRANVKAAHEAGLQVIVWTANRPSDWDRLRAAGVDAIITDDPAALLAWLNRA